MTSILKLSVEAYMESLRKRNKGGGGAQVDGGAQE